MSRAHARLIASVLLVAACVPRPLPPGEDSSSTGDTGDTSVADTDPTGTAGPDTLGADTSTSGATDPGETASTSAPDTSSGTTGVSSGECPPCDQTWEQQGSLTLIPGEDLGKFACMSVVHGHLTITGDFSAEELAPLCHVRVVDQWLSIRSNALLTELTPFAAVEEVNVLDLYDLPALGAVSGLDRLRDVNTIFLSKTGATALGAFDPDFKGVSSLDIAGHPALTDLSALNQWGLLPYASVRLRQNPALVDLSALGGLFAGAEDLYLELDDLPGLTSLAGLEAVSPSTWLSLSALPQVTDLTPLAAVAQLDGLQLSELPLTSLAGLGALQSANLSLRDMPALTSLDGLGPLAKGGVHLRDLPLLASLAGLESLAVGDLTLVDLPLVDSLAPLAGLVTGSYITLFDLPQVTSLAGLDNLSSATSLMIGDCVNEGQGGMPGLTSLAGLGALEVAAEFMLANNPNLTSLAGAASLVQVFDRLTLVNNAQLSQAEVDAFLAQVSAPEMTCFGDWGVCDCVEIIPP